MLMMFMVFFSFGISFVNTFMPSLIASYGSDSQRGMIMGMYESIGSISRVIGPLIAYSVAIQYIRFEYVVFSFIALSLFVIMFLFVYKLNKDD